ncbi:peptidoglycan DD-metalloendopeptidase family protein [Flavobacterium sp.]|jgi:murein DD-endopeptidase MepM/ murein hydrolase activator NlpD|uniref:peptidoglycan DD-metalloendopeptidase family protein n=1 Tax=Flavobacterium sp. TaxID=239 RepID=UPI0037C06DFA
MRTFDTMTDFEQLLASQTSVFVMDASISLAEYVPIDLSITNTSLAKLKLKTAVDYENHINEYLTEHQGNIAFGGYVEHRNLYQRSTIFNNEQTEERNIHIGLDLWIEAGTKVLAALDGQVHSFQNNNNLGDYGPTILLEHVLNNYTFYTLYGHLSLESITPLKIGQQVSKGEAIASLGTSDVNGDYAPHLHFQIIRDLGDYHGDYPGVCSKSKLNYYLENCPDPKLLLNLHT